MSDFIIDKDKHIQTIIDNFNFVRVHNMMKLLNWTWFEIGGTPTVDELKKEAIKLLNEAYYNGCEVSISTGGFKAIRRDEYLELEFIVTDYDSEYLNYGEEYERLKMNRDRKIKLNQLKPCE